MVQAEDSLSLHAVYRYKLAHTFPINEEATFEAISKNSGLNPVDLRRILRHATTNHIFCEPREGIVAHTAASKLLAENRAVEDMIGTLSEEKFKAAASVISHHRTLWSAANVSLDTEC